MRFARLTGNRGLFPVLPEIGLCGPRAAFGTPPLNEDTVMAPIFGFLGEFSLFHWLIVAGIGILLFGKRLPEVGRSLAKGIVEFRKGLKGLEDDVDVYSSPARPRNPSIERPR